MQNTLLRKGFVLGIILLCLGTSVIPGVSARPNASNGGEILVLHNSSKQQGSSLEKGRTPVASEIGFFYITVDGYGTGFFLPFRRHRDHFFCFAGTITLSGFFNLGHVTVNNETYYQPLFIFFTGFFYVLYNEYVFRDYIRAWGFSFHRPLIL